VVVHRSSELAERVYMLCGCAPGFLVYRWWSAKSGVSCKPAHVFARTCVPPSRRAAGSVSFTPDHDPSAVSLTLSWEEFFATYEPSADIEPLPPFMHDPILCERGGEEIAARASVVVDADRTLARLYFAAAVAREASTATRSNSCP
jgi:hypothetical protein